jgi:hypothetical protein
MNGFHIGSKARHHIVARNKETASVVRSILLRGITWALNVHEGMVEELTEEFVRQISD